LSDWFSIKSDVDCARQWDESDAWERAHSNESELWSEESDRNRELIEQAWAIQVTNPAAALRIYLEAADAGSPWAMQQVGWHYRTGAGVAADFERAQDYYRRAICAGSWTATISYARLLAEQGHFETCEQLLEDGVRSDFVPAYFWLARFRHRQSKSRKTCREIRPLLEYASEKGHPAARGFLAALMLLGKYRLRESPVGFRLVRESIRHAVDEHAGEESGYDRSAQGGGPAYMPEGS